MSSTTIELKAIPRTTIGKSSHVLAAADKLPAVVYGAEVDAMAVEVDRREFERLMAHASVGSTLIKLSIEGQSKALDVIIKEIQPDPVKGITRHIDFWAVRMGKSISTVVAIAFEGSSEGERNGGVMLHELRELHIEALPKDLPEHIVIDVSALQVGESLHVSDLVAPAGVTIVTDPDTIICAVAAPALEVEEEAVEGAAEAAEVPEVGETESGDEA